MSVLMIWYAKVSRPEIVDCYGRFLVSIVVIVGENSMLTAFVLVCPVAEHANCTLEHVTPVIASPCPRLHLLIRTLLTDLFLSL